MKIIIIAEDDSEIELKERGSADRLSGPPPAPPSLRAARTHPDARLEPARADDRARTVALRRAGLPADHRRRHARAEADYESLVLAGDNLRVEMQRIDTSRRAEIEALDPTSYDHVLVLGYSDHMAPQPADTRTLVTLLHLRRIGEEQASRSTWSAR